MEDNDSIATLRNFSKLDFQSKKQVINDGGRPMPEWVASNNGTQSNAAFSNRVVPPKRLTVWLLYEKSPFLLYNNWVHIFVNLTLKKSVPHQPRTSPHVSGCSFIGRGSGYGQGGVCSKKVENH